MTRKYMIGVEPSKNIKRTGAEISERWAAINNKPAEEVSAEEVEMLSYAVLELHAALQIACETLEEK